MLYAAALLGTRGVNGDYYRNTVLLDMLLPDIRSVFGDYGITFFSKMGHRHIVHMTLLAAICCRERDARVYPCRDVATQFARFEFGGLQHQG